MTGRGMALIAAARRALAALPGAASARIVRDRRAVDVPLSQHAAHLLEPGDSRTLAFPESPDWQWELGTATLATVARGRAGDAAQQRLAELHEAALAALRADADLLAVVADGPADASAGCGTGIAGVRFGPTRTDAGRPGDPLAVVTVVGFAVPVAEPQTSVTIDGAALLASGPHELTAGTPQRAAADRVFAGLAGALTVDLGPRPRTLTVRGRLSAPSRAALAQLELALESRIDGRTRTLVDRDGAEHPHVRIDRFTRRGPVELGLRCHRPYELQCTRLL